MKHRFKSVSFANIFVYQIIKSQRERERDCPLPTQQIPKNKQSGVAYVSLGVFIEAKNAWIKRVFILFHLLTRTCMHY